MNLIKYKVPEQILQPYYDYSLEDRRHFEETGNRRNKLFIEASIAIDHNLKPYIQYSLIRVSDEEPVQTYEQGKEINKFRIPTFLLDLKHHQTKLNEQMHAQSGEPIRKSYFEATIIVNAPYGLPDMTFDLITPTERAI